MSCFLIATAGGTKEREEKAPAVSETWSNFTKLTIKCLKEQFAQSKVQRAKRKPIYGKLSTTTGMWADAQKQKTAGKVAKVGNFCAPAEPQLALVIRIRAIKAMSREVRKGLQLFCREQFFHRTSLSSTRLQEHVDDCGTTSCVLAPGSRVSKQLIYLQAWLHANWPQADHPLTASISWPMWYHRHGGSEKATQKLHCW